MLTFELGATVAVAEDLMYCEDAAAKAERKAQALSQSYTVVRMKNAEIEKRWVF